MSVKSCKKLEKSQVELIIEVGAAEFNAAMERAYKKMSKEIRVPGFRPGKAPRKVVEQRYGAEIFFEEAINFAFPEAYEAALTEENLQVVGYPDVELVGDCTVNGFTFKAVAPVYPEVTLGEYKGLTAERPEVKVTAADVNARLKVLADRNTRLVSVDRAAQNGDTVVIDFEGFLNGEPFEGGKGENFNLELGSGSFVPGFEDQLVGTKSGDEKELDITFPEDYVADLAGKAVVFKVKVNDVKEKDAPEMDDEFAKDVSEFDTLKELKADLKRQITEERNRDADRVFGDALMTQVADGLTADIPDAMIEGQQRQFVDNLRNQMIQQGMTFEDYLKMTGTTEEKLLEDAKEPAIRQVRMDLALAAIIKAEGLEVSDEDVEAEYKSMAEQYQLEVDMVKRYVLPDQVKDQLVSRRALDIVVKNAKKAEKAVKEAAPAEAEEKPAAKKAETAAVEEAPAEKEEKSAAKKPRKSTAKKAAAKKDETEETPSDAD